MQKVYENYLSKNNHYGYRYYFIKTKLITKSKIKLSQKNIPKARLTLDNHDDVKFFKEIYKLNKSLSMNISDLVKLIKRNKEILEINLKYNEIYKTGVVKLYYLFKSKINFFEI